MKICHKTKELRQTEGWTYRGVIRENTNNGANVEQDPTTFYEGPNQQFKSADLVLDKCSVEWLTKRKKVQDVMSQA